MTAKYRYFQYIPLEGLSEEERMARVQGGCHHDFHMDLVEFFPGRSATRPGSISLRSTEPQEASPPFGNDPYRKEQS